MFYKLLLTRNGFAKKITYIKNKKVKSKINETEILRFLNVSNIEIEDGFTLRSYFKIFENYPILKVLEDWIEEYVNEAKASPNSGCFDTEMPDGFIQLSRLIDIDIIKSRSDFYNEKGDFDFNNKKRKEVNENNINIYHEVVMMTPNDKEKYAIEFTPLKNLLDIPVVISGKTSVIKKAISKNGKVRFVKSELDNKNGINFYDFITEIIYEVSFLGEPSNKVAEKEKLQRRIKELKNNEVNILSVEEVKEKMSIKMNKLKDKKE
jgi:hypothetical protein